MSLKKSNKLGKTIDSLLVSELREEHQIETVNEMHQFSSREWEGQELLEIYSETPFRLHPDSGLMAGAGYLKIKLRGQGLAKEHKDSIRQSKLNIQEQQLSQEKLQVKQVVNEKRSEKVFLPQLWFICLVTGIVLLFLLYKGINKRLFY